MPANDPAIGVIGGSGLYELEGLSDVKWQKVQTPFGSPSDAYCVGRFAGRRVVFLPRHGRGHRLTPSELNFRANIWGLRFLGAQWVISISAVGSMKEAIRPLDLVIPDQFFDATRHRVSSFFGAGIVAHVGMAEPVCPDLATALEKAANQTGATVHRGGTYICIEGPQFSTKAESRIYRGWGVDVIGMTNMPEAKLEGGGAVLRDARPRHGLRRLARDPRDRVGRDGHPEPPEERRDGEGRAAASDPGDRAAARVRVPGPPPERRDHEPEGLPTVDAKKA